MELQFTQEQLHDFECYESVRASGAFNMFDPNAKRLTGLSCKRYSFVMRNYSELRAEIERKFNVNHPT